MALIREPAFVEVRRLGIEIYLQIERQFYSTEIKISYNASQRFCFASVISLNDLNDLRVIEVQSLKCQQNIDWPGTRDSHTCHCLNL